MNIESIERARINDIRMNNDVAKVLPPIPDEGISLNYLREVDKVLELIPIYFDVVFKKVFTKNPKELMDLLNSVLKLNIDVDRAKIRFENAEGYKENYREYQKREDIMVVINNKFFISIEVNNEDFENVKRRNEIYKHKRHSMILETGEDVSKLKQIKVIMLNLNIRDLNSPYKEQIIYPYDVANEEIYDMNDITYNKYIVNYEKLYYNGDRNKEVVWLTALTTNKFEKLYKALSEILPEASVKNILMDVISMSNSNFNIHEWEKEKLDKIVEIDRKDNEKRRLREIKKAENDLKKHTKEFQKSKYEFEVEQYKFKKSKDEFQKTQDEFQKSQDELQKNKDELQKSQDELQKNQDELQKNQNEFERSKKKFKKSQYEIMAKKLLKANIDIKIIKEITGLSTEEINNLKKQ